MGTYRIRDKATGQVISIPWDDPNSRPSNADIANYIKQNEAPSIEEINSSPEISIQEEPSLLSRAIEFLPKINPITPGRNPLQAIPEALNEVRKPVDDAATFYSGKMVGSRALQYGPRKTAAELAIAGAGLDPRDDPEATGYGASIARPVVGTAATVLTDPTLAMSALRGVAPAAKLLDRGLAGVGAATGAASSLESGSEALGELREQGMNPRALELLINAGLGAGFGYLGYKGARGPKSGSVVDPNLVPDVESPIGFNKTFEEARPETHPQSTIPEIDMLIEQGTASQRSGTNLEVLPELESSITNDTPPLIYDADGSAIPITQRDYGPRVREALLPQRETPEIYMPKESGFESPDINAIRTRYRADEAARDYRAAREPIIEPEIELPPVVPENLDQLNQAFDERMEPPPVEGPSLLTYTDDLDTPQPVRDIPEILEPNPPEPSELITDIPPEISGEKYPLNDKQLGEMIWEQTPKEAEALSREAHVPRKGRKRDFERWLAAKEKRAIARLRQANSAEIGGFQRVSDIATVVAARGARILANSFDEWREQLPPDLQSLSEPTLRMAYSIIQAGGRAGAAAPDVAKEGELILPPDFIRSTEGGGKEPPPPTINLSNEGGGEIPLEPREPGPSEGGMGQAIRDFTMSTGSQIKKEGKAGQDLYRLLHKTRLDYEAQAGQWQRRFNEAIAPLDKGKFDEFVTHMDEGTRSSDPNINAALDAVKKLDDEVVNRAVASGMGFRTAQGTKQVPFKGRTGGYWPHIFGEEFFKNKDSAIDALMKGYESKEGKPLSRREAEVMLRNARAFGERLISAQHQRKGKGIEGWRRDAGAYLKHIDDMARRITESEQLGPLDIGSPTSRISQLIEQTTNPDLVYRNVKRILKRDREHDEGANKLVRGVSNVMAWANLSNFMLGNFNQNAMTPLRSTTKGFLSSVKNLFTKEGKKDALDSGALQTLAGEILLEEGKSSKLTKVYGMDASERLNRSISSGAGRFTAGHLFDRLKKNPKNSRARAQIEDLLLEDADSIIKQDKLTDEQLNRAGGRMSEITQGRAQPLDLPYQWSSSPYMQLILLFKKYAFRQTRMIADAIKANPARNIPAALILFQVMGELTGDAKSIISGGSEALLTGEDPGEKIQERIETRGDWIGSGSPVLDRLIANYSQSWFLGILGDILEKGSKKEAILEFAGGPVLSQGAELAEGLAQASKGKPKPLAKTLGSKVPVIGSGVRRAIGESEIDEVEYPDLSDIPIEELERLFQ